MSTTDTQQTGTSTERFREARDQLLAWNGAHEEAVAGFRFPDVGPVWNWAVDWFDAVARDNAAPALVIVRQDGARTEVSFADMAARSDRVAAWLLQQGVGRGDAVMVVLGNQVELWETMLGVMKAGAVIMPTTTALGSDDLADRVVRGDVRAVVCNPADTGKFDQVPGDYLRIAVGEQEGWLDLGDAAALVDAVVAHPGTRPQDRLLLYFTSGTTSRPKLVEHTQVSYPVGHLTTMYWLGLRPGDVHLNISSPGWAKHAWSCLFAPWNAEATVFLCDYTRFDAAPLLGQLRGEDVTSFCAPPTVWRMLINADLGARPASLREAVGAGEPLNPEVIRQVERQWGLTIRDGFGQTETTAQIGNTPGSLVKPGSMGRPLPGVPTALVDPVTGEAVQGAGEGEICLDLSARPVPLMTGYQGDEERNAEAMAGGYYH
ncbi:MAG: AMP-dependent synthetase and ligase, partial [Frankiales bacterium]|nr:AMP-dependent synthetase and ligase [Frankiales bacterium]